jgi:hypothetical protein
MTKEKLPALQFYPGDWKKDPGVQALSYHDRGVWFEILLLMHESEQRGKLLLNGKPMPEDALARILGLDPLRVKETVNTILLFGVASRENETGAMVCRRMMRDEEARRAYANFGKQGGNPSLCGNYNKPGFVYAAQRAGDGAVKIGISENPSKRIYKIRYSQKQPVELLAFAHVEDMGKAEAEFHARYKHASDGEWFSLKEEELSALLSTLKGESKGKPTPSSSSSSSTSVIKTLPPSDAVDTAPDSDVSDVTATVREQTRLEAEVDRVARAIWARHPNNRKRRDLTVEKIRAKLHSKIKRVHVDGREAKLACIDDNHDTCCRSEQWRKNDGEFVKSLSAWFNTPQCDEEPGLLDAPAIRPQAKPLHELYRI